MKRVIVIAGLTATGKSKTAITLAKQLNAEIISADSVAVYKGMDIGSAKVSKEERDTIKHHLVDIRDYKEEYNVALFQKEGRKIIEEIHSRNKNVIVVGGTGLYIKALLYDYQFKQEEKSEYTRHEDTQSLYEELGHKDPIAVKTIHPNNRKRIIRALESFDKHQQTRDALNQNNKDTQVIPADIFFLQGDRTKIYQRIDSRVLQMFDEGLEKEVQNFYDRDSHIFEYNSFQSIGYREFEAYLKKEIDRDTLISLIQRNTRRFAKRQITWFKHQQPSSWIDIFNQNPVEEIQKVLEKI